MIAARHYKFPLVKRKESDPIVGNAAMVRLAGKVARAIVAEEFRGELSKRHQPPARGDWTAVGVLFRLPPTKLHPTPSALQVLFNHIPPDAELVALDRQLDVFLPLPHNDPPPPRATRFPFHETFAVIWRRGKRVLQ